MYPKMTLLDNIPDDRRKEVWSTENASSINVLDQVIVEDNGSTVRWWTDGQIPICQHKLQQNTRQKMSQPFFGIVSKQSPGINFPARNVNVRLYTVFTSTTKMLSKPSVSP
ncbi:uncharacterized protein LOC134206895 [Armigeres subalbatus]|uniref:uncharacterized protein LOC134206895 n=1 Tax=Armigeres subalbatus TaxID=124917 RepID=UPI002ED6BEFB